MTHSDTERLFEVDSLDVPQAVVPRRHVVGPEAEILHPANKITVQLSPERMLALNGMLEWIFLRERKRQRKRDTVERMRGVRFAPLEVDGYGIIRGFFAGKVGDRFDAKLDRIVACTRVVPDNADAYYILEEFWKYHPPVKRETAMTRRSVNDPLRLVYGYFPEYSNMTATELVSQPPIIPDRTISEVKGPDSLLVAVHDLRHASQSRNAFKSGMRGGAFFIHPYFVDKDRPHPTSRIVI